MKVRDSLLLVFLLGTAGAFILFSDSARQGAYDGLVLAQNTIIPGLTPLLIIFLLIMKTSARDILARCFGFLARSVFNLPHAAFPAIFLGLLGGYPTGALLTKELLTSGEIDEKQAKRMMRFNFCGGAGFIVTAVGTAVMKSREAGLILLASNIISSVIIGFALSFTEPRSREKFYSYSTPKNLGDALTQASSDAVGSILNITAFVILFSAFTAIVPIDSRLAPIIEITNGICTKNDFSLPQISAYLAFGGLCIHFQLLGVISDIGMKPWDFLLFRIIGAALSYAVCRLLLLLFPQSAAVFLNNATGVELSGVNTAASVLMIVGCFALVLDLRSQRKGRLGDTV